MLIGYDGFFKPALQIHTEVYEGQFLIYSYEENDPKGVVANIIHLDRRELEILRQQIEIVQREQTV